MRRSTHRLAIGYVCCVVNACVISWLWYHRSDDPEWLFTNLFFAGFVNAFSGLLTTFVNIYGAQGGQYGAASSATLAVASTSTAIYTVAHRGLLQEAYTLPVSAGEAQQLDCLRWLMRAALYPSLDSWDL